MNRYYSALKSIAIVGTYKALSQTYDLAVDVKSKLRRRVVFMIHSYLVNSKLFHSPKFFLLHI